VTKEKKLRVVCPLCSARGTPISIDITEEIREAQKEVIQYLLDKGYWENVDELTEKFLSDK